jgi:mRNA-degrading endonuclease toxin of MazEF toxin-antitoxin module
VWVNFGYNIGVEFGGHHPAIILRNNKESLFVAPLSSQIPKDMNINVFIDYVYGYEKMDRYVNVLRLCHVSIIRVDLLGKIGTVKGNLLDEIIKKQK